MNDQEFDEMVTVHYPRIRRAALLLSKGDPHAADDLAQETLLAAARGRVGFQGASQPSTWLYSILLNQHRQRHRSNGRLWRRWKNWFERKPQSTPTAPDAQMAASEWSSQLWSAVAELPVAQQQAVILRYSEELSYAEIAQVLGCPIGTVKSRVHHALGTLQRQLREPELIPPTRSNDARRPH